MPVEDKRVDKASVKALVTVYGPREAARIAGLKPGTVMGWCSRYKWRKVAVDRSPAIAGKDPGDALRHALENSKAASTLNLAKYTEKASEAAVKHKNPLDVGRKVRDVAGVYSTLWPAESEGEMIESGILLGTQAVGDDSPPVEEIKDANSAIREIIPG